MSHSERVTLDGRPLTDPRERARIRRLIDQKLRASLETQHGKFWFAKIEKSWGELNRAVNTGHWSHLIEGG